MRHRRATQGLTLIEVLLGALTLLIAIGAILGAYVGQVTLNEHARNLSLAVHDANRVIEQMRQLNVCDGNPTAVSPNGTWDAWMNGTNGGAPKSIDNPDRDNEEFIAVTCTDRDGGTLSTDYCATSTSPPSALPAQVGDGEWTPAGTATQQLDPIRVTVAVCWRHRKRTIGECNWNGTSLSASDTNGNGVIESPAMLTTLITCR